jgi:hypothetical protein
VRLVAGGSVQIRDAIRGSSFLSSQDPRLHFGLGAVTEVDTLEVRWPGGGVQRLLEMKVNRYHVVTEW